MPGPNSTIDNRVQVPTASTEDVSTSTRRTIPIVVYNDPGFDKETGYGYWGFGMSINHTWTSGLHFAPKAAKERTEVAIWRAHSAVSTKIVTVVASRVANVPAMPSVDTNDTNDVLLQQVISLPSPEYTIEGVPMVLVAMQLTYVCQMARDLMAPIMYPNSVLKLAGSPVQLNPAEWTHLLHGTPIPPLDWNGGKVTW